MATSGDTPHSLNLALQGGGAHGAFTWGVLDALLEDGRLGFDGITGTSAGAMNAVLLASGWRAGLDAGSDPREFARAALAAFWDDVGRRPTVFSLSPFPGLALSDWPLGNPMLQWLDVLSRVWSALPAQSVRLQPAAQYPRAPRRLRCAARGLPVPSLHRGHQRTQRARAHLSRARAALRHGARLGLPAVRLPGRRSAGRPRQRAFLGRRLHRQPRAVAALLRHHGAGPAAHPDQSAAARRPARYRAGDHRTQQRDRFQRVSPARAARDRLRAAPARRAQARSRALPARTPAHDRRRRPPRPLPRQFEVRHPPRLSA
ncbi:MAG: patatin-like phospholipase family protein [Gammaproteobacteria bacterium]